MEHNNKLRVEIQYNAYE